MDIGIGEKRTLLISEWHTAHLSSSITSGAMTGSEAIATQLAFGATFCVSFVNYKRKAAHMNK